MVTTIAFYLLVYCIGVLAVAGLLRLLGRRFRGLSARMAAVFGVFAAAAAYVWLDLGPELDYRIASEERPVAVPQGPRQIEI